MSYQGNAFEEARRNELFRKVLFTGERSQLVVMTIPPGESVGEERHERVEQTLFFLSGTGRAELDGKTSQVRAGDAVIVTPGTRHNFINTGTEPLRIVTVYAPPNHIDKRVHATHAAAEADAEDEAFGEAVR